MIIFVARQVAWDGHLSCELKCVEKCLLMDRKCRGEKQNLAKRQEAFQIFYSLPDNAAWDSTWPAETLSENSVSADHTVVRVIKWVQYITCAHDSSWKFPPQSARLKHSHWQNRSKAVKINWCSSISHVTGDEVRFLVSLAHLRCFLSATVQALLQWAVRSELIIKSIQSYNKGPLYGNESVVGVQQKQKSCKQK